MSAHIVIGAGEVGSALAKVLSRRYRTVLRDVEGLDLVGDVEAIHVAFPFSDAFVGDCNRYIRLYSPRLVLVHSTVPIGTTFLLGENAVHTPVEGLHPNLERSILTFCKHFGGERAKEAARIFERLGIKTKTYDKPEITEAQKILSTSQYGLQILIARELERLCRDKGLDYKAAVLDYTETYNQGYGELGFDRFIRPSLFPSTGPIGGHCVVQNACLISEPKYTLLEMLANVNGERIKNAEAISHNPGV